MRFSKRLTDLREERDLHQKEIAALVKILPSNISKYEKGLSLPKIDSLVKLAAFFEVSVDYLLGLSCLRNPYATEKFSPREVEIIAKYRRLSPEQKIRIDERMTVLLEGSE